MHPLQKQVAAFAERYELLPRRSRVVVAVSGGPDSLCLLHVLLALAPGLELQLHVAHLDHMLRPESAADAGFVAGIAEAWGLPLALGREDVAAHARASKTGVEAAARALRYRFLSQIARQTHAKAIAVGHTADDQAETVVLRLMRGAGPGGLAAMRPRRRLDRGQPQPVLVRPLLETGRDDVERYCRDMELAPRHDRSNQQPIYARNRVRGYILPLLKTYNANIVATLGRTARILAEEDELVDDIVDRVWEQLAQLRGAEVVLDRTAFAALHPALRRRVLRRACAEVGPGVEVGARHIDLALAAVGAGRKRMQLPGSLWLRIERDELRIGNHVAPAGTREEGGCAA